MERLETSRTLGRNRLNAVETAAAMAALVLQRVRVVK